MEGVDFSSAASLRAARLALCAGLETRGARLSAACDPATAAALRWLSPAPDPAGGSATAAGDAGAGAGGGGGGAGAGARAGPGDALLPLLASALLADSPFEPLDSAALHKRLSGDARYAAAGGAPALASALRALAAADAVELEEFTQRGEQRLMVLYVDAPKLAARAAAAAVATAAAAAGGGGAPAARHPAAAAAAAPPAAADRERGGGGGAAAAAEVGPPDDGLEALLSAPSHREREARAEGAALLELLTRPTAREAAAQGRFRRPGGAPAAVRDYCPRLTRAECARAAAAASGAPARGGAPPPPAACGRLHFVRLTMPHTDVSLGDCSFLDTCRHMRTCRFVHYAVDPADAAREARGAQLAAAAAPAASPAALAAAAPSAAAAASAPALRPVPEHLAACPAAQWVCADVRTFDLPLLGQFGVIMADPPWDIHMDLPYGTMADDEMRAMRVTGRAMELGRECLQAWGYRFVQELVWVKTNQLQRLIRTGRTGHWLNHSKEHCLVGAKGPAAGASAAAAAAAWNRHLDCDVVVAEVRETSRKPDEMYGLLERLSPGTRKLEVFGREHNTRPGWVTLGNQLPGARLVEEGLRARFLQRYPDRAHDLAAGDAAAPALAAKHHGGA